MQSLIPLNAREVRHTCDFVALVSRYTRLRRAGAQYVGLCPFHGECNPSFYIEPQRKIWHCFGCERGGDVFAFVMLVERCDFPRALQIVFDFCLGVARESEPRSGERFRAREGGEAPSAREAGCAHSPKQSEHARLVTRLDATEKRNAVIRAASDAAFAEFERDCEPRDGGVLLLVNKRITGHE